MKYSEIKNFVSSYLGDAVTKDSISSILVKAGSAVFSFVVGVFLARFLGAEKFGIYSFCLAVVTMVTVPTKLGLPNLIIRFVAEYHSKEYWAKLKGLLKTANWFVAASSVIAVLLLDGYVYVLSDWGDEYKTTMYWASLLVPIFSFIGLYGAALRGFKRITKGLAPEGLLRNGLLCVLILILFWGFVYDLNAVNAMFLHVVAASGALIFALLWLHNAQKKIVPFIQSPSFETKRWISVALPFLLTGGMQVIKYRTDIILLGIFSTSEMVGIYEVVVKGATLVAFGLNAINQALGPYFSSLYARSKLQELQALVTKSARIIFVVSFPVLIFFVFKAEWILNLLFGDEYILGASALIIICCGQLFNVFMGSVGLLLVMTDYERDMLWAVGLSAGTNILLNLILIPLYDIQGAAIASAISMVFQNIMMGFFVYRRLKIRSTILGFM